jgi:hypothetical protein
MKPKYREDVSDSLRVKLDAMPRRNRVWNGWTRNFIPKEDGFITHAWEEGVTPVGRSFCGMRLTQYGGVFLGEDGWMPGCLKCRAFLRKSGLVDESDKLTQTT